MFWLKGIWTMQKGLVFLAVGLIASAASADIILFDFESEPVDGISNGNLTELTVLDAASGLSVEISRSSGVGFDVLNGPAVPDTDNSYPASFGDQALSPFANFTESDFFVANFSSNVISVSIDAGDFAEDPDTITLQAFSGLNGTGTIVDTDVTSFTGNLTLSGNGDPNNDPVTASVSGEGIQSITFVGFGGSDFPNSVFFDNLRVSTAPIPEPGSATLLLLSASSLIVRRKR